MDRSRAWLPFICIIILLGLGGERLLAPVPPGGVPAPLAEATPWVAPTPTSAPPVAASPTPRPPVATPTATAAVAATMPATASGDPPEAALILQSAEEYIYIPASARLAQPARVLVTLHGVGGEGKGFCRALLAEAERNGWIVLAPTFRYQNWHDPAAVVADDVAVIQRIKASLDSLPERAGVRVRQRVLFYGFSRGGQVAHRFALAYPGRVKGVAVLSAGTFTLPATEWTAEGARRALPLPFGTADLPHRLGVTPDLDALRQVPFWIGVGAEDNRDGDVPPAWTAFIGPNRVARARAFTAALQGLRVPATLTIFPAVGHQETPETRASIGAFLRALPPDEPPWSVPRVVPT